MDRAAPFSSECGAAFFLPHTLMSVDQVKGVRADNSEVYESSGANRHETTLAFGDFVDGGAALGTYVLDATIPAGALYRQTLVKAITGFAGDTTATIQVGDGTDADRYSTGTPDVFATLAGGVAAGVASGTNLHAAAISTVTVTITAGSDWGLVTAGQLTVVLLWDE